MEKHKQLRIQAGAKVRANRELATLRNVYNFCRELELYEGSNPVENVKMTREPRQQLRVLEVDEEARLLAVCAEPLRALILVGVHTGVRLRSEGLSLKWSDVDLIRRTLTVSAAFAKNGVSRTVSLNSTVLAALSQLTKRGDYVFANADGAPDYAMIRGFRVACRKAGLVGVHPHVLRHTFASRLLASGVDPIMATKLGGWSSIKMLDRYCHADPSRMSEAVEKIARHSTSGIATPAIRRIGETA